MRKTRDPITGLREKLLDSGLADTDDIKVLHFALSWLECKTCKLEMEANRSSLGKQYTCTARSGIYDCVFRCRQL